MSASNHHSHGNNGSGHSHHHILSDKIAFTIWIALLVGTVVTVAAARVNLGALNFPLAMLIATIKAALVVAFFMGIKYDVVENRIIAGTALIFAAIFFFFVWTDLFFRGDVYVKPGDRQNNSGPSKFAKAWIATDELKAHGKELFAQQCATCHGASGHGDGAAAAALNPKPRNFTQDAGWKNGRKPSQIFGTLTKGLGGMPSFGSLPQDDRWALAHYVITLGPAGPQDTTADLKAVGIDPNDPNAGGAKDKTLPIDFAIERMIEG